MATMMEYRWTRFWCSTNDSYSLADNGFLYDPESTYGGSVNPCARAFADIEDKPCLVLLGEPGIGKSTVLEWQFAAVGETSTARGDNALRLDLGVYGDESRLNADVFESELFTEWLSGGHQLHVFLDSLDECLLQIQHVAKVISAGLERCRPHLHRLRLRICCRTADWPSLLDQQLGQLWGEAPAKYELLPLRRKDVVEAATTMGLNAGDFLREVARTLAEPFAIRPITFQFLLRIFRDTGGLPSTQKELYEEGCQLLCEERNLSRQSAGQVGRLSASEKLQIAERIAAVSVFCGKTAVNLSPFGVPSSPEDVTIPELVDDSIGTAERVSGEEAVREALATGLFSGRGDNRLGFAHRTYAEFLAASYLARSNVGSEERLKFIQHPDDPNGSVVPQLRETAAWLASIDRKVFRELLRADPQVLIRCDVTSYTAEDRRSLVEQLIALASLDKLDTSDWNERNHYHKLAHPSLAEQLRPIISDNSAHTTARHLAIDLAEACGLSELQDELSNVALEASGDYRVRCNAARAVVAIGDERTKLRLKSLALVDDATNAAHELKTVVLRSLWPQYITAVELFAVLQPLTKDTCGPYGYFLSDEMPQSLQDEDLPHALRWTSRLSKEESHTYRAKLLIAEIARRSWARLDIPEIFDGFVEYSLHRLNLPGDLLPSLSQESEPEETTRRKLAEAIVNRIEDFDLEGYGLLFRPPRIIRESDTLWMLDRVQQAENAFIAGHWAKLIDRLFDPALPGLLDKVLALCESNEQMRSAFSWRLDAVALDSPAAERSRKQYAHELKCQQRREEHQDPTPLDPPPAELIEHALCASESGNPVAWYAASRDLQLEPDGTHYDHDFEVDLTKLPGWQNASESTHRRLIEGAQRFLVHSNANGAKWLGTNSTPYHALWGYKALFLLNKEAKDRFDSLSGEVWAAWAPIVISYSDCNGRQENTDFHDQIAAACCAKAPDAVNECLRIVFSRSNVRDKLFVAPQFLSRCSADSVTETLCEEARNQEIKPAIVGSLLETLLKRGSKEATQIAESLLSTQDDDAEIGEKRILAAIALLRHAEDAGWSAVWPKMRDDDEFGTAVINRLAEMDMFDPTVAVKIREGDCADLYIWLESRFPHASDPPSGGRVTERQAVSHYRDGTLRVLQHRGTLPAIRALERIECELPHLNWMPRVVAAAKEAMFRRTWRPLTSTDLFAATRRADSRLVRSAGELQNVILESLAVLQESLQGETPAARDLWDKVGDNTFRPTDENHLADYIKRHLECNLRNRAIVSLREVEIRRSRQGGAPGERTDIHVTGQIPGFTQGLFEQVRVIIEVKGSWHQEVETAMETQLVNRYLLDNSCRHGIYLVGWYRCQQWDGNDVRLKKSRKESCRNLLGRLFKQASGLSNDSMTIKAFVLNAALR